METNAMVNAIQSQYLAGLDMLGAVIDGCPVQLWLDDGYKNRTWHVAYHALFYVHLYLQHNEETFQPWSKQRQDYNFMGPTPFPPHEVPVADEPYTREEINEYLDLVRGQVRELLPQLEMEGPSGFHWLPMSKLELQLYNIRHLMLHTGELAERLGNAGIDVGWVGMVQP